MKEPERVSPHGHRGASTVAVSDTAAWLPNLRTTIVVAPQRAVDYLRRLISPRAAGVPREQRVDALGLLAEAYLRLHEPEEAVAAAAAAWPAARALDPADSLRVIAVTGVAADIAVRTGHADAQSAAIDYYTVITEIDPDQGSLAHQRRLLLAAGLVTAAVYHTDCHAGRAQLNALRASLTTGPDWPAGLAVITHAVSAAQQLCHGQRAAAGGDRPPPMPGGLLYPDVHHPAPHYLADCLTAHPPIHTHDQPANAANPDTGAADLASTAAEPPGRSTAAPPEGNPR